MVKMTIEEHVAAEPARVFEYATDLRRAAERIGAIRRLDVLTDGPVGVGTRFRETRVVLKREATEEMEITSFDPPRGYTVGCESHGCRYVTTFEFAPRDGGTEVRMTFDAQPLGLVAKLLSVLTRPMMKAVVKECAADLRDLKAAVEAGT